MPAPLKNLPTKTCEQCGALYTRHRDPSGKWSQARDFQKQRFCSVDCQHLWALSRFNEVPNKICEWCGNSFSRPRKPNGKPVARAQFAKRRFCSVQCNGHATREILRATYCRNGHERTALNTSLIFVGGRITRLCVTCNIRSTYRLPANTPQAIVETLVVLRNIGRLLNAND